MDTDCTQQREAIRNTPIKLPDYRITRNMVKMNKNAWFCNRRISRQWRNPRQATWLLAEDFKNIGVAPMKEALIQGIKETFAKASDLDFYCVNTNMKSIFFCFLEKALVKMIYQEALNFILTKTFVQLLQSDDLVSALIEKIGAQCPHSPVIPITGVSSVRRKNMSSKDDYLVALRRILTQLFTTSTRVASQGIRQKDVPTEKGGCQRSTFNRLHLFRL